MISPLTKKERELYRLNPTIKTEMDIAKEDYLRRKYGNSIILQSELGNTKIVYFYNFETLEIEISSCEGHLATLKKEDLDELVGTILEVNLQDYYDYYGPFLMGTKVKVHGYFGKGGYDPITNPETPIEAEYVFYDKNGKEEKKIKEFYIKDKNGKITNKTSYEDNYLESSKNENDNYLLPEDMQTLYEKKLDKTIYRFSKLDDVLGQNILVQVNKSKDNGKKYYTITNEPIQVSQDAKYVILNEDLMFASKNDKIMLSENAISLYVSNDGGRSFKNSKVNYKNENADYITIEKMPYFENSILKIKCSVYQLNSSKDNYEDKELIFVSYDNGENWNLQK